jgi:hypothetical protein
MIPTFKRVIKRKHRIYTHAEIDDLHAYLTSPDLPRGAITKICRDTGIPESALRDWHASRMADDTWFPVSKGHPQSRALNPGNETATADFLRDNYIRAGLGATRTQLRHLYLDSYAAQSDEESNFERFCASTTFLHDFQTRQGLSLRTPHKEWRAELDESYAAYFLERLNSPSNDYPPDKVFNMDETCWRLFEAPQKVLAEKGAETVKLLARTSEKTSFTALGTISASGQKLPLWVLAKGKTPRLERKFGAHPGVILRHTDSGWATENLISSYIEWLHRDIAQGYPAALILDVYPTHRTDLAFQAATGNDVELLFVPVGPPEDSSQ